MNNLVHVWCNKCSDNFPMRQDMYDSLEKCGNTFYCPQGHALVISRESILTKLQRAERQATRNLNTISILSKREESLRGVQTRQRNRLLCGACPYCRQIPRDMVKHIKDKHRPQVV